MTRLVPDILADDSGIHLLSLACVVITSSFGGWRVRKDDLASRCKFEFLREMIGVNNDEDLQHMAGA